ncbi:cofactor assembly of complex C subunit B [Cyanobium sp. CH-040]|uniref:cofactor assembly of complex C subunit B n=1 Tax=Cyanobium sp. CH-040 TaxID=2823708 RepID=UPI0020CEDC75|nr:cofactor assembly of complex C subunit B [Cyanobium sp. CH-040]MCP9926959.1 cofactor assembly of complex C subunit B [Cyanobium sp. CH-040]
MALPMPARVTLGAGLAGLLLVVVNQLSAPLPEPPLTRAGVLAALLAVGLMLVAALWTRAVPEAALRAPLQGQEGLVLAPDLPERVRQELGWGSQMLLTASPAAVVLVWWQGTVLLRRGLLVDTPFVPGPICTRALQQRQVISLVNLALYPGRDEFESLLPGLPAVLVQPLEDQGLVLLGGWSARCFSRSDLTWVEGWARRLRAEMLADAAASDPDPV